LPYSFSTASDRGRRRQANEDSALAPVAFEDGAEAGGMFAAVADGVGGAVGGAVASATAIARFREYFLASASVDPSERLRDAVHAANRAVLDAGAAEASLRGMATTLVGIVAADRRIWFANVGDSRGYLLQDDHFYQVTSDHSLVASAVQAGVLTPEEAARRPERHAITRSLGHTTEVDVDTHGPLRFSTGDIALLCSDGLHDAVAEEAILEILRGASIATAASELVRIANEAGGPDNITVVVLASG
jgi:protein phosphatase